LRLRIVTALLLLGLGSGYLTLEHQRAAQKNRRAEFEAYAHKLHDQDVKISEQLQQLSTKRQEAKTRKASDEELKALDQQMNVLKNQLLADLQSVNQKLKEVISN